jgi:hypothetical protein
MPWLKTATGSHTPASSTPTAVEAARARIPLWPALAIAAGLLAGTVAAGGPPEAVQEAHGPAERGATGPSLEELSRQLEAEGLSGRMHGADTTLDGYVFTWRDPKNFFHSFNFSMVPGNGRVRDQLTGLERHQAVTIRGRLIPNPSPQPHVRVEELEPGEKWDPGLEATPLAPAPDVMASLSDRGRIPALVHAVGPDGGLLVIEHRDAVLPVVVPDDAARAEVASLYRGDRIELQYQMQGRPGLPPHLVIDAASGNGAAPLVVTDRIRDQHETRRTVEGSLVLFPKSPVLQRTIYGIEERGPDGLHRYFTLFNFDDALDQARIEEMLSSAWKKREGGLREARNKYVHPEVRVRATGRISNPDPNQANPTILVGSRDITHTLPPNQ